MAAIAADAQLGLSMRFEVVIDGFELGSWSTCKGLSVSFKHEKVKELGEHTMNAFIPGSVEYPPIQLTRAMAKADWDKTKEWLQTVASAPWLLADNPVSDAAGSVATVGMSSAKITLRDAADAEVASWSSPVCCPTPGRARSSTPTARPSRSRRWSWCTKGSWCA